MSNNGADGSLLLIKYFSNINDADILGSDTWKP